MQCQGAPRPGAHAFCSPIAALVPDHLAVPGEYAVIHGSGAVNVSRAEGSEARVPGLLGAAVPVAVPSLVAEVSLGSADAVP